MGWALCQCHQQDKSLGSSSALHFEVGILIFWTLLDFHICGIIPLFKMHLCVISSFESNHWFSTLWQVKGWKKHSIHYQSSDWATSRTWGRVHLICELSLSQRIVVSWKFPRQGRTTSVSALSHLQTRVIGWHERLNKIEYCYPISKQQVEELLEHKRTLCLPREPAWACHISPKQQSVWFYEATYLQLTRPEHMKSTIYIQATCLPTYLAEQDYQRWRQLGWYGMVTHLNSHKA